MLSRKRNKPHFCLIIMKQLHSMISKAQLNEARLDLAHRAKQGMDFITAATIIWSTGIVLF
jgi:hypothetical protein